MTELRQLAFNLYQKHFDEHLADALGFTELNANHSVSTYGSSSSDAPIAIMNMPHGQTVHVTPPTKAAAPPAPKMTQPEPKCEAASSGKGSGSSRQRDTCVVPGDIRRHARGPYWEHTRYEPASNTPAPKAMPTVANTIDTHIVVLGKACVS